MMHRALVSMASISCILGSLLSAAETVAEEAPARQTDVKVALQAARQRRQPLLVFVTHASCKYCRKMEQTTFTDPSVERLLSESYVVVEVDGHDSSELVKKLHVRALPTTLVVRDEAVVDRIEGYLPPESFAPRLARHLKAESR